MSDNRHHDFREPDISELLMRIVVTEYPKSGATWVVSMLGDALKWPKRDIYVDNNYTVFDVSQHPWYAGWENLDLTPSCVIKSHEQPQSALLPFPAHFIHLVRDGRDVIVSKYFYEKEFCVANGIYERFEVVFDDYVPQIATEWRKYVLAWLDKGFRTYKYEDFLYDPHYILKKVLTELGMPTADSDIAQAVAANTKDKLKRALNNTFTHNTFVRKGTARDWLNHFNADHIRLFKRIAGDVLITLGYENDLSW